MSSALRVNRVTNTVQNSCSEPPLQLFKISLSAFSVLTKRKADSGDTIAPHEQTSNAVTCALEYSRVFIRKGRMRAHTRKLVTDQLWRGTVLYTHMIVVPPYKPKPCAMRDNFSENEYTFSISIFPSLVLNSS